MIVRLKIGCARCPFLPRWCRSRALRRKHNPGLLLLLLLQPSLRVRRSGSVFGNDFLRVGAGAVRGGGTYTRPRALQLAQLVPLNGSCCNLGADQERGALPPPFSSLSGYVPVALSLCFTERLQRFIQLPAKAQTKCPSLFFFAQLQVFLLGYFSYTGVIASTS